MAKEEIVYGPLELPSGKIVKFREAKGFDRLNVISAQQNMQQGQSPLVAQFTSDSYISIKCITEIDGVGVQKNYKDLYEEFSESDLDFYEGVRTELFGVKKDNIKEKASFLRKSATSIATSN